MSMTVKSEDYFRQNAEKWDEIRSGYFTEAVRAAAIQKAYLRPEMIVADVGAGTGYLSAGLAPLVRQVWVLDGSAEMLDQARKNLADFDNIEYRYAEALSLPLSDAAVDAVFANMYLHHIPDPAAALQEMVRILRPGGRLILTDMDAHPYGWFREEMADVWLGFDRPQVQAWFEQAGLVNVMVINSGQSCQAESLRPEQHPEESPKVQIRVFLAVGTCQTSGVKEAVQVSYGAAALKGNSCCTPEAKYSASADCCGAGKVDDSTQIANVGGSCCGDDLFSIELIAAEEISTGVEWSTGYTPDLLAAVPTEAAQFSLGCGNPTAMANLRPGETVLDIGSGGGLDAFIAARQVGSTGKVIGVDMTPEMLARARQAAQSAGISNVEFRKGEAEALPIEPASIDVILSNCVINLVPDKSKVFRETFRVLRPGGRLEISDMVTERAFLPQESGDAQNFAGCIYGALPEGEYIDLVQAAGFTKVQVQRSSSSGIMNGTRVYSIHLTALKPI